MNINKQYKITLQLLEKAFKKWNLYKIAEIRDQQKESYAVLDILTGYALGNKTQGNLIFKSHYCDVIDNSQIF